MYIGCKVTLDKPHPTHVTGLYLDEGVITMGPVDRDKWWVTRRFGRTQVSALVHRSNMFPAAVAQCIEYAPVA